MYYRGIAHTMYLGFFGLSKLSSLPYLSFIKKNCDIELPSQIPATLARNHIRIMLLTSILLLHYHIDIIILYYNCNLNNNLPKFPSNKP